MEEQEWIPRLRGEARRQDRCMAAVVSENERRGKAHPELCRDASLSRSSGGWKDPRRPSDALKPHDVGARRRSSRCRASRSNGVKDAEPSAAGFTDAALACRVAVPPPADVRGPRRSRHRRRNFRVFFFSRMVVASLRRGQGAILRVRRIHGRAHEVADLAPALLNQIFVREIMEPRQHAFR